MLAEKNGAKTQLSPTSQEYAYLEYGLQLSLNASTARIVNAYTVTNPNLSLQFEKSFKEMLVVPIWVDASELTGGNTEEDVIRRGFRFTQHDQGAFFSTGSLPYGNKRSWHSKDNPGNASDEISTEVMAPRQRTVLLCRMAVGRAFPVLSHQVESTDLPAGYDSFYITDYSSDCDKKDTNTDPYYHVYYIRNPAQILPIFLVHFDFDIQKELKSRELAICDNCEEEPAAVYCTADAANLCRPCDNQLHASKLTSRHVRTAIGKGSDVFGYCRHHPEKLIEFYCSQCHIPVCVFCKMVGNHANGEAARHQLVSVSEAYQSVLLESQTVDPILHGRKSDIHRHIAAIHSRGKAVQQLRVNVESQIEDAYKKAMADIHRITEQKVTFFLDGGLANDYSYLDAKMNVLLGDESELKRQLGEMDRLDSFLKYLRGGDATTYLFNWSRHQMYRSELHDFSFLKRDIDVQLDAKLVGSLSVIVDEGESRPGVSSGILPHSVPSSISNTPQTSPLKTAKSHLSMYSLKSSTAKIQRRTSDLFAEALGALDSSSIQEDDDFDSYAETASGFRFDE